MLKKEFVRLLFLGIFVSFAILLINWPLYWTDIFLTVGVLLGTFIYDVDHLIYVLYWAPQEFLSQRIKWFFDVKQYKEGIGLTVETKKERNKLIFHSIIFQIALAIVTLFVLTSSLSLLGKGLVLGLLIHSLVDNLRDIREDKGLNWYWQTAFKPTKEIQIFVWGIFFTFYLISALFLV